MYPPTGNLNVLNTFEGKTMSLFKMLFSITQEVTLSLREEHISDSLKELVQFYLTAPPLT
jgi:hypothetical protein